MKRTFYLSIAVILFSANSALAQISQGTVLVGASTNLSFTSTSVDGVDEKLKTYNIEMQGGYFVLENLALGVGFAYSKMKFEGLIDESTTAVGLFGRYYVNGKFFFGAGYYSVTQDNGEFETDQTVVPFELGYAAFVTHNIAIEPSLAYNVGTGDNGTNTLGINLGFALYFNRK